MMSIKKLELRDGETEQIYGEDKTVTTQDMFTVSSLNKAKTVLEANLKEINRKLAEIEKLK